MSVSWGTQYAKLKTNLRLAANRLRLLQKKKTEQAMKARTEIADFLLNDKEDRARIRVESIIREDFVVEAYELLEMFCELLMARFGVIQQMKEIDEGIAEAVASLLWVAPRISHEVSEFKIISAQLEQKYGKQYAETARMNQLPEPSRVSPKLIAKLSTSAPNKLLIEKYLIEISRAAGIEFTPDPKVMREDDDEVALAERNLINFMNDDKIGWNVPQGGGGPHDAPPAPPNNPPPGHQGNFPPGNYGGPPPPNFGNQGGGGGGQAMPAHFNYPTPNHQAPAAPQPQGHPDASFGHLGGPPAPPPQLAAHNPAIPPPNVVQPSHPPPSANIPASKDKSEPAEHIYEVPNDKDFDYEFPEPPTDLDHDYMNGGGGGGGGASTAKKDDLNFEDLTERFKRLTKKN
ncbi:IST1-like protein [Aphelenchoides fujianensis]|nr:IST1-like protein [Aphelenchoides fujianensis]